jgi:hypothetical protein
MIHVTNALAAFHREILEAGELCRRDATEAAAANPGDDGFTPAFDLPPLDDALERFYAASTIQVRELGLYRGRTLRLLDLTCNPRTRTTKTFASHVMVARAVRHIQRTGESVLLVTPSSANKGGALRDAVLRAIECGLARPEQLRIAIVLPRQGLQKLWASPLSAREDLRALNPVFVAQAEDGSVVKRLTRAFVQEYAEPLWRERGLRVWHTYHLDNYRMADALRAALEARHLGRPPAGHVRVHAQAVSSAFGLLGYDHGRRVMAARAGAAPLPPSQWLLVQHLGTPDLVLHRHFGSCSRTHVPTYRPDPATGLLEQFESPVFPTRTFAADEVIDSTFYSQNPITADRVQEALGRHGGGGIVVSLHECLERYAELRALLAAGGPSPLPADPRRLREWALAMLATGALSAIDRDLVPRDAEIVLHASGNYTVDDYEPVAPSHTHAVENVAQMRRVVLDGLATAEA